MAPRPHATPRKRQWVPTTSHASPVSVSASASTLAASARSQMSVPSGKAITTPPTSRTGTTTTSERGCTVSSSTETRRCLVKELEVFNMADDDETVSPALEITPMKDTIPMERSVLVNGMDSKGKTPDSSGRQWKLPRDETDDPGLQYDAWAVDDWANASQSMGSARTSPCNSARGMGRVQREVADAVLSDLQIDLQAQVHRAISEMSSWISEEITFARQQYQESMEATNCQVNEMWRTERLDMQSAHSELSCKVDRLHTRLEEHIEAAGRLQTLQEEASCRIVQVSGSQPSASVMEARLVAEERKWRLKLEELQDGLAKQHQRIDALDVQSNNILSKLATRDVALIKAQTEELQQNFGKHLPRIDKLDALCNSLGETIAEQECRLQKGLNARSVETDTCTRMMKKLTKETGDLARQIATIDAQAVKNSNQLNDISAELDSMKQEHLDELEEVAQETMGCARKVMEIDARTLENSIRLSDIDAVVHDHLQKHEASLGSFRSEIHTHLYSMRERFEKSVSDLGRDCRRELSELYEQLRRKAPTAELHEIRDAVQSWVENARQTHQVAMEGLASSLERVASTSLEHGTEIRKHQNYMKELSLWINEGASRDECITEVLLHIVEEDYPDLMAVLERRLQRASQHSS